MNAKVTGYINNLTIWQEETKALRQILLGSDLQEDFKWGKPCYTAHDKNVVVIQPFKKYFALLFMKGNQLADPDKILVKTGPNTVVGRQIRFKDVAEINQLKAVIKKYVKAAAAL